MAIIFTVLLHKVSNFVRVDPVKNLPRLALEQVNPSSFLPQPTNEARGAFEQILIFQLLFL